MARAPQKPKTGKTESPTVAPYVNAFFVCENVIVGQDNVLSVIRIVSKVLLPRDTEQQKPKVTYRLFVIASVTRGPSAAQHVGRIRYVDDKREKVLHDAPIDIVFKGGEDSVFMAGMELLLKVENLGRHWFQLIVNGKMASETPMTFELVPDEPHPPRPKRQTRKGS